MLLGGQDGWLNSTTMLDQWPLWRDGTYVRMPLSLEAVREHFPHKLVLDNKGAGRDAAPATVSSD